MDRPWGPVAVGAVGGVLASFLPAALAAIVLIIAALAAGWLLPLAPMKAAALFLLPTVLVGFVRMLLADATGAAGAFAFGIIMTIGVAAIFTHVGAGVALRRQS